MSGRQALFFGCELVDQSLCVFDEDSTLRFFETFSECVEQRFSELNGKCMFGVSHFLDLLVQRSFGDRTNKLGILFP